nr:MAG: hypothetical protein E4H34_01990 [Hyphomicrobiales bacterium]
MSMRNHGWPVCPRRYAGAFAEAAAIFASFIAPIPPLKAAENGAIIADFAGYWARPEPARGAANFYPLESGPKPVTFGPAAGEPRQGMPYIGDDANPILLPHAAEAIRAQRDMYARGEAVWSAWALCWPTGVPLNFGMVNALQFLQAENEVTMIYQRGQTVRHIYLNEKHPPSPAHTWFGHSVGHYEGENSLVIDTIAQDPRALVDRFGTPKSDAIRVVERYTISADRRRLDVLIDVEDPKTFTTSWSATIAYTLLPPKSAESPQDEVFAEIVCPENNRDAGGGGYPIPMATHFDF